ncbi:hypothetical protein [Arthrobacter sp. KK5.5]|uniref:hypothetical protein n=1 Tax=Arthrobacter sp. KK5.5 TaxID=3373084 RepID=UPI003EE58F9E
MEILPQSYEKYLETLGASTAHALRPVFLESVAEGDHGVHVRGLGTHYEQAFVDDKVPFGEVRIT